MKRFISRAVFAALALAAFSPSATPAQSLTCDKLSSTLCSQLQYYTDSAQIRIAISLKQPLFDYPNTDPARTDSLNRNLVTLRPCIDSLFLRYDLRSTFNSKHRLRPGEITYAYDMHCYTSKNVILALAQDPLVSGLDAYFPGTPMPNAMNMPDSVILHTSFPFDTVLHNFLTLSMDSTYFKGALFFVSRYALYFVLAKAPGPAIQPEPFHADFYYQELGFPSDVRYPSDGTALYHGTMYPRAMDGTCATTMTFDTSWKTHEYRFPTDSKMLYLKITQPCDIDSIKIRFDTVSQLQPATKLVWAPKKTPGLEPIFFLTRDRVVVPASGPHHTFEVTIYDACGRTVAKKTIDGAAGGVALGKRMGQGVYVVRIGYEGKEWSGKRWVGRE